MKRTILLAVAFTLLATGVALAAVSHETTRSNVSKKPGLAFVPAGASVTLVSARGPGFEGSLDATGKIEFKAVAKGDYSLVVKPFETPARSITGVEVWGGVVDCKPEGVRDNALTCKLRVTLDGRARTGDIAIAVYAVAPERTQ